MSNVLPLHGPKHSRRHPDDQQRGPLRPAGLISARRRVNGAAASFSFRLIDAAAMLAWVMASGFSGALHGGTGLLLVQPLLILAGLGAVDLYHFPKGERLRAHLSLLVTLFATTCGITALVAIHWVVSAAIISWELKWALPAAVGLLVLHSGWWCLFRHWRKLELLTPNIVVIGATAQTQRLISGLLASREANVIGIFDDRAERSPTHVLGVPVLGKVDDLIAHRLIPYIDSIVIGVGPEARTRVMEMADQLSVLPNDVYVIDEGAHNAVSAIGGQALSHLAGRPFNPVGAGIKRTMDLILAILALIILAPVFAVVAVAIALDSKGPVFFRQRRHGFNNEEIMVWKFRSMRTECSDATASRQVTANDERVTRVGRFIRRTSLDELPQLINIIRGEMSVVGPRPHAIGMKTTDSDAAALLRNYAQRHRLKPGLTGWAAINGSRGPVDDIVLLQDRIALDLEYVDRQSFWLDLWIVLRTLPCLLGDKATVR